MASGKRIDTPYFAAMNMPPPQTWTPQHPMLWNSADRFWDDQTSTRSYEDSYEHAPNHGAHKGVDKAYFQSPICEYLDSDGEFQSSYPDMPNNLHGLSGTLPFVPDSAYPEDLLTCPMEDPESSGISLSGASGMAENEPADLDIGFDTGVFRCDECTLRFWDALQRE